MLWQAGAWREALAAFAGAGLADPSWILCRSSRKKVRRVVAAGADTQKTTVEQVMSAPLLAIDENKSLLDANDLMAKTHIRHLGVTEDGKLVGLISVRDLVLFLTNLPRK